MALTAKGIKAHMAPGRYHDGLGLYLIVKPSGRKSWIYRYQVNGRRRDSGLGPYPEVTLAEARELHFEMRRQVKRGVDPLAGKQQRRKVRVFQQVAEEYIKVKSPGWGSERIAVQWSNMLKLHAYPGIGATPIDQVSDDDILGVLQPVWVDKPTVGKRLRSRLENVMDYATAKKERTGENPARWKSHLQLLLPAVAKLDAHYAAMAWKDVPAFMRELRQREGVGARALEFLVLTASRSIEVRGATWDEVDIDAAEWRIPASRYKTKREHRVPLSGAAVELLEGLPRIDNQLFSHGRGVLYSSAMSRALQGMRSGVTVHGFRSAFKDWAGENGVADNLVSEMALGHKVGKEVENAYRRGDLFDRRRELMAAWAEFINS